MGRKSHRTFANLFSLLSLSAMFHPPKHVPSFSETAFVQREKSIRNSKDLNKVKTIALRRKVQKLSELSKTKRRAIYYYNLRHPVKMYA